MRTREDFVRDLDVLRAGTSRCPIVRSRAILADYDSALARIEELEARACPHECFAGQRAAQAASEAENAVLQARNEELESAMRLLIDGGSIGKAVGCSCTLTRLYDAHKEATR